MINAYSNHILNPIKNIISLKKGVIVFTISLLFQSLSGQIDPVSIPSPDAASLGLYGQIPVGHYTGTASVGVSLFSVQEGKINLPLSLSYHAAAVKPENFAGITGLGWTLLSGGSITRVANGAPDEIWDENLDLSYYEAHNHMQGSMWYSDYNMFNDMEIAGHLRDLEPDEFIFSANGISGSFYMDHTGNWVVVSENPSQVKVSHDIHSGAIVNVCNGEFKTNRFYTTFTLTDGDGTQYIFGEGEDQQTEAIEFTGNPLYGNVGTDKITANTWHLTKIISPDGDEINFTYERYEDSYGYDEAVYQYFKSYNIDYNSVYAEHVAWKLQFTLFGHDIAIGDYNEFYSSHSSFKQVDIVSIIYPSYLKSITSGRGNFTIKFNTSVCDNILDYDYNDYPLRDHTSTEIGLDNIIGADKSTRRKLDNIILYDKTGTNEVKRVEFNYNLDDPQVTNKRLFLESLDKSKGSNIEKSYNFIYDQGSLPEYNSGKIDHWGFFLNKTDGYFSHLRSLQTYRNMTAAYADDMQHGILKKIVYPTGGSTEFEYEPHDYSMVNHKYPNFNCEKLYQDKITGGLRIHKIINKNENNVIVNEKEYTYETTYNGQTYSSGILVGEPNYFQIMSLNDATNGYYGDIDAQTFTFSDRIMGPLSYKNGSHITYSRVIEKETGNGYTEYKYSNFDNPLYQDAPATNYNLIADDDIIPYNNLKITRGKLLEKHAYKEGASNPLESTFYTYDGQSASRIDYNGSITNASSPGYLRAINPMTFKTNVAEFGIPIAYKIFTFCPTLSSETVYSYDKNFSNPVITTTDYIYTIDNQISEVETSSSKETYKVKYKYPPEAALISGLSGTQSTALNNMVSKNIIQPVIEEKYFTYANLLLSSTLTTFKEFSTGKFYPQYTKAASYNNSYNIQSVFYNYDDYGNITEASKYNDVHVAYYWGYNGTYPVVKAIGTSSSSLYSAAHPVYNSLGYQNITDPYNNSTHKSYIKVFHNHIRSALPNALIYTYTYKPLVGITSQTDPNGKTTYYEYDTFGRLKCIRDDQGNKVKEYYYNYIN